MNIEEQKKCYLFKYLYNKYKGNKTQKEISDELLVTEKTIQNWLAARNKITKKNYIAILEYYNLPTNLFDEDILNVIVMYEDNYFIVNEIILDSLISKNNSYINDIDIKKEKNKITNLIKETFINIANSNNYSISYDDIKEETTNDIYNYVLSLVNKDYKKHLTSTSSEIKDNQLEYEIKLLYQELYYKIYIFFLDEFNSTKIKDTYYFDKFFDIMNNDIEIKEIIDELSKTLHLFYKGDSKKVNDDFQSNYKKIVLNICDKIGKNKNAFPNQ